jgi:hypothetical protein
MQEDGNLVLYRNDNSQALWSSGTSGKPVAHAIMQGDGNFVLYDNNGVAYWSTGTWGNPGAFLILQDDGNLVVYGQNGQALWASKTALGTERLDADQQLNINDKMAAANKRTTLILQGDGNLVLYRNYDNLALWSSNTPGKPVTHAIMQGDGNFVLYDNNGVAYWSTGTSEKPGAFLILQDDGNLVVYGPGTSTEPLWASMTTQNWDLADPGPPAILVEFEPAFLLDVTDVGKVAEFINATQSAIAPIASKLQSAELALVGPAVVAANNLHDNVRIVRVGLWLLSPYFPFAAPDPNDPHQLPVLTPACAATGFNEAALIGVPGPTVLQEVGFAFAIPITALNTLANAELANIQAAVSKIGSVSSITVTGPAENVVVTTVTGRGGVPPASISGTITETLGLQAGTAPNTHRPLVTGNFSSGTDVGNQVLLAVAGVLSGADILGTLVFAEALGITLLIPFLGGLADPPIAQLNSLVNMIPSVFPFEPEQMVGALPDFPTAIFNWPIFGADTSRVVGNATVTFVSRGPGSGSLMLSGPAVLDGIQDDMAGGASVDYTATWTNMAPQSIGWQVSGRTGDAAGSVQAQVSTSEQGFTADFPLPDPVNPGQYHFSLTTTATEVNIKDPTKTPLTASAVQGVVAKVRKNPPGGGR